MSVMRGADGNAKDPHRESVPFSPLVFSSIHSYVRLSELFWAPLLEESFIKSIICHSKCVSYMWSMKQACDLLFAELKPNINQAELDLKSSRYVFRVMNKSKSSAVTCKVCFASVSKFSKCPQVKWTLPAVCLNWCCRSLHMCPQIWSRKTPSSSAAALVTWCRDNNEKRNFSVPSFSHSAAPWQHIRGRIPLSGLWLVSAAFDFYIFH